jgi:hypothetical protein
VIEPCLTCARPWVQFQVLPIKKQNNRNLDSKIKQNLTVYHQSFVRKEKREEDLKSTWRIITEKFTNLVIDINLQFQEFK